MEKKELLLLEQKLDNLGSIKEIINNEYFLYAIISYNGDRRLLYVLFNKINKALKDNSINEEDLAFFRSGKLIDAIINLHSTTEYYAGRKPYTSERLDKINYISILEDEETLSVSYTHPRIIDAICGDTHFDNKSYELIDFIECGIYDKLPTTIKQKILLEIQKRNNLEIVEKLSSNLLEQPKTYQKRIIQNI